jgi:hypothetical protein
MKEQAALRPEMRMKPPKKQLSKLLHPQTLDIPRFGRIKVGQPAAEAKTDH